MAELQDIEMIISTDDTKGVFAISLVEKPAIEEDFIALSSHSNYGIDLKIADKKRGVVVGLALVPDKRIFREMKGQKFNIFFSKSTIAKSAEMFMKKLHLADVTEEHAVDVDGPFVFESWIVEDTKNDKSNIFNLNAPEGSWVIMMKINNGELLEKIDNGTLKGFSIEGGFDGLEKLEQSAVELTDDQKVKELQDIVSDDNLSEKGKIEQLKKKLNEQE